MVLEANGDNLHGWNPHYRNLRNNLAENQFEAFDFNNGRPGNFRRLMVQGTNTWDHQGHIIPQNMLLDVLRPIAEDAHNNQRLNLGDLNNFLVQKYPQLNFQNVTNYIEQHLIQNGAPELDFARFVPNNIEDSYGGYFSVIVWNPLNICRAPDDNQRGGNPGNNIDFEVIEYLLQNHNEPGINLFQAMQVQEMQVAFQAILDNRAPLNNYHNDLQQGQQFIRNFIAACNASLANLQQNPSGFYQFPWHQDNNEVLVPGAANP